MPKCYRAPAAHRSHVDLVPNLRQGPSRQMIHRPLRQVMQRRTRARSENRTRVRFLRRQRFEVGGAVA